MKKIAILMTVLGLFVFSCTKNSDEKKTTSTWNKKESRSLASLDSTEAGLVEAINQKITSITSKGQINSRVSEIVALAAKEENKDKYVVQLYAAVLEAVPLFEGIVWRMRGVVEKTGIIHLAALDAIRGLHYQDYMVGPHLNAALEYVVTPSFDKDLFETVGSVQNFVSAQVIPSLQKTLSIGYQVVSKVDNNWGFDFDQYLISGHNEDAGVKYLSDKKRFKRVIKPHLYYGISFYEGILGTANYGVVYDFDKTLDFITKVVKKSAINNSVRQKLGMLPNSITPKDSIEILRKRKFKSIGKPRMSKADAQKRLDASLKHYDNALRYEELAYLQTIILSDHSLGNKYIVNPKWLALREEKTKHRLAEKRRIYQAALQGKAATITSDVTGQQIRLNVKALFTVQDDLKVFLPEEGSFAGKKKGDYIVDSKGKNIEHKVSGKKIFAWDYFFGKPNAWPDVTFAGFLPDATNSNIYEIVRTLKHTASTKAFSSFIPVP